MKVAAEASPKDVRGITFIFKYSFIHFFLDSPKNKAEKEMPKSVEKVNIERFNGPMSYGINDISLDPSGSFVAYAYFFLQEVSYDASVQEMWKVFCMLGTIGTS